MVDESMRILVLSFYYAPDLAAGSFRTTALVKALTQPAITERQVDVITTLPNRYKSFSSEAPEAESCPGLSVRRIPLPSHSSDVVGQARAFWVFARRVLQEIRGRRYDVVFGTSSRLMTAVLAALCARRTKGRLYLDIRDLFSDTVGDVFPASCAWLLKAVFSRLEAWTMRSADKVNLVSRGFARYFEERYPGIPLSFISNGIDPEFLEPRAENSGRTHSVPDDAGPIRVVYAGNIGEGQGLHNVLPGLARRLSNKVGFRVIGDGGRRAQLEAALSASGCTNVELILPVPRVQLLAEYDQADVLFLHLNDFDAFKKVLPSKLFEYAASGKPIWAGVSGYAAEFIRQEVCNAAVFPPCDVDAGVESLASLALVDSPRPDFIQRYGRARLMQQLAADVLAVAARRDRAGGKA